MKVYRVTYWHEGGVCLCGSSVEVLARNKLDAIRLFNRKTFGYKVERSTITAERLKYEESYAYLLEAL